MMLKHGFRFRTQRELQILRRETRRALWKHRLTVLLALLLAAAALLLLAWTLFPTTLEPLLQNLLP